jgi:hypothetical protein
MQNENMHQPFLPVFIDDDRQFLHGGVNIRAFAIDICNLK